MIAGFALGGAFCGCERFERLEIVPPGGLQTHYLVDYEYLRYGDAGFGTTAHEILRGFV